MRIAYVAPYHGRTALKQRPIIRNRSLAGTAKIELLAAMLRDSSHEVEILSQGEVIENSLTYYPPMAETEPFRPDIPVYYSSSAPVRGINGVWSEQALCRDFRKRHLAAPFDAVIIYNLKSPQIACANYALRNLGIPVIVEYEDDRFVDVQGQQNQGYGVRRNVKAAADLLPRVSGGVAVSPHLLSQFPAEIPKLLLRGVVGMDVIRAEEKMRGNKRNIVLFSGTHIESNGVAELIEAWRQAAIQDWELHITGQGHLTERLRTSAADVPGIVFHGLVDRAELVAIMSSARICVNPHRVSQTPGNVFAFKIVEYLASGGHVVTTPMGSLEPALEAGITYMADNAPATIAGTLKQVIAERRHDRNAAAAAQKTYGPAAVTQSLNDLLSAASSNVRRA